MAATTDAPLADFRIVGYTENYYQAAPDAPRQPGGTCWHCGTGIAIEVIVKRVGSDEMHTIGTTCAERVGMDVTELREWLAERYREQRELLRQTRSKAFREETARREAEEIALHGPHGTETRYTSGCRCTPCIKAAPHGTTHRFWHGECRCPACIEVAMADDASLVYRELTVVVDVDTGEIADARLVDTRYGSRWCVNDGATWLPLSPKRRTTQASKGYVEATAMFLAERIKSRNGTWYKRLARMSCPIIDAWGEPIARPEKSDCNL